MIISVVGNISSGKTTLAKKISSLYSFAYIPSKRKDLQFLDTFFRNIPEHFFATQTSFLINKISEIDEKSRNNNIVIDRILFEDIHVFAQYWMENYPIDEKEIELYKNMADYLVKTVPKTDIYILCQCDTSTILDRFGRRAKRTFENKYPLNYIQRLSDKYASIVFPNNAVVVEINTNILDTQSIDSVYSTVKNSMVLNFIRRKLNYEKMDKGQL